MSQVHYVEEFDKNLPFYRKSYFAHSWKVHYFLLHRFSISIQIPNPKAQMASFRVAMRYNDNLKWYRQAFDTRDVPFILARALEYCLEQNYLNEAEAKKARRYLIEHAMGLIAV